MRYLHTLWRDFSKTYHRYSSCEWPSLERFSRSKLKDQGHSKTKCTYAAKANISAVWRRGSLVFCLLLAHQLRWEKQITYMVLTFLLKTHMTLSCQERQCWLCGSTGACEQSWDKRQWRWRQHSDVAGLPEGTSPGRSSAAHPRSWHHKEVRFFYLHAFCWWFVINVAYFTRLLCPVSFLLCKIFVARILCVWHFIVYW